MALAHFRMLIYELLNKDPEIVPEEDPLIIWYSKYSVCMDNNDKYTKSTRHISSIIHLVRNGESARCTRSTGVREV